MATAGHNLHIFSTCTKHKEDKILDLKLHRDHKSLKAAEKNHISISGLIQLVSFSVQCFYWMLHTT